MISSVSAGSTPNSVSIVTADGSVWFDDLDLPADTELRRELAAWIAAGGTIAPFAPVADPDPVPASISRRQCAEQMFVECMISIDEAIGMAGAGTPPPTIAAIIDALPEAERGLARIRFAAGTYERSNALLVAVITGFRPSATPGDVDAFFRAAAAR
jgi:hypothetical protein